MSRLILALLLMATSGLALAQVKDVDLRSVARYDRYETVSQCNAHSRVSNISLRVFEFPIAVADYAKLKRIRIIVDDGAHSIELVREDLEGDVYYIDGLFDDQVRHYEQFSTIAVDGDMLSFFFYHNAAGVPPGRHNVRVDIEDKGGDVYLKTPNIEMSLVAGLDSKAYALQGLYPKIRVYRGNDRVYASVHRDGQASVNENVAFHIAGSDGVKKFVDVRKEFWEGGDVFDLPIPAGARYLSVLASATGQDGVEWENKVEVFDAGNPFYAFCGFPPMPNVTPGLAKPEVFNYERPEQEGDES